MKSQSDDVISEVVSVYTLIGYVHVKSNSKHPIAANNKSQTGKTQGFFLDCHSIPSFFDYLASKNEFAFHWRK